MRWLVCVMAWLVLIVPAQAAGWTLSGTVLEKGTGRPLPGVVLVVSGQLDPAATTDDGGAFRFELDAAGEVELVARYMGVSAVRRVRLEAGGEALPQTIYLRLPETLREMVVTAPRSPDRVSKSVISGKTLSSIQVLDAPRRIDEIARMLGGATITDTTRKHAAEMLGAAA